MNTVWVQPSPSNLARQCPRGCDAGHACHLRDALTLPLMLDPCFLIAGPIFSEFPTAPVESLGARPLLCATPHGHCSTCRLRVHSDYGAQRYLSVKEEFRRGTLAKRERHGPAQEHICGRGRGAGWLFTLEDTFRKREERTPQ